MSSKNRDIQTMASQYEADRSLNINPLSMLLNGVIDAAVMGGISNYDKIFFADGYLNENPSHADDVKKLRQLIEEQVCVCVCVCVCVRACVHVCVCWRGRNDGCYLYS